MKFRERKIKLIVGLGNPESKYQNTRHNAGMNAAQEIFKAIRVIQDPTETELEHCTIWKFEHVAIAFPNTFMNESGEAVAEAAKHLRAKPEEILVAHDDLETPPGKCKVKEGGSAGGHNGLKSTIEKLGSREFMRVKVGIGRPESREHDVIRKYVLEPMPPKEQAEVLDAIIYMAREIAADEAAGRQRDMAL